MSFVLLGAGGMGELALRDLVASSVKSVVVADYDERKARILAEKYGTKEVHVSAMFVDANDRGSLLRVMRDADVVASTIGPFSEYGVRVLRAAIEAGVNFVDICDDPQPTVEGLNLHDDAKQAGVTAVIGLGNNPGVGNLCAKYGAQKLDEVEEIKFIWVHPAISRTGEAATLHAISAFSGSVPAYQDGQWVYVPAGSEKEVVEFPDPVGRVEVYHSGHPEPVTIPRYIKVRNVFCKGGIVPVWAGQEFIRLLAYGLGSAEPIDVKGVQVVPRDFTASLLKRVLHSLSGSLTSGGEIVKASRVIVRGVKGVDKITYTYDRVGNDWEAGTALSIGAQMVARGEVRDKGVFPPEGCIDPQKFFHELKKRGLKIIERITIEHEI
ncbi:MAG: saccharopine dehydrogenase NADP-binding domain-containing protein [Candidatus Freyarchaeota archaeon]|nr:saccharopine dehydrogenase NADP-binding domain-containing protein [Candidatus Jordarchaeia archaeon]